MVRPLALVAALAVAAPASAGADSDPDAGEATDPPAPRAPITTGRRIAAVAAAVGPGFVVRGAGSWLVGERRTAKRLAQLGAIGLGAALGGGLPVAVTGGYPPTLPLLPVLIAGSGLLFTSWWADIAVAAGVDHPGTPRALAPWSIELGTVWQHDALRERGFVRLAGQVAVDRVAFGAIGLIDAEGRATMGELDATVRILGAPPTGGPITSGSRLAARLGGRAFDDDDDRVRTYTGELELIGRLDLVRLDRVLDGTFVQLSSGIGVERVRLGGQADHNSVLLGTFSWGAYLGSRGEATLFYDHRRDSLQGGIAAWRAAGFIGSLGAALDLLVAPRWAVRAQLDYGSSWLATFAIRYQGGAP